MIRNLFTLFLFSVLLFSCAGTKRTQEKRTEDYGVNALIIDAVTEYGNGNNAKAETLFKSVLAKDKDNATALYYLSGICFENQDFSSALSYGKQAAEKNSNIWYKIQLCEIYMALQDYDNAASVLEKIVKQEPQVLEYWQQLALIYHVKGDKKGEISVLDRMEERFGVNEMTSMQKFQIYRENKDNKKAEQEIIKLAEAFPSQTKYLSILAEMKMKEKDYQSAFRYYNKVKETDPDNEDINIALANYYMTNKNEDSTFFYLKKTMAQKNIDTQSKIRVIYSVYGREVDTDSLTFERFFSLLETIEKSGDTADCKTYVLLNTGYMRKQDYPRASQTGQEAIKKGCNDYSVFQNVLFAMSTFASPDTMISFANLAIETYPEQPLPYLFKGINQEINEDYRSAVETFEAGVVLAADDKTILEDLYMNIGDCYHALNDKEKCFAFYDKALEVNPDNVAVLNNYAYYLSLENKNLNKALEMAEKVVSVSNTITYLDTYAWVLYKLGRYSEAKRVMDSIDIPQNQWDKTYKDHYKQITDRLK